jgi:hypothetical protein
LAVDSSGHPHTAYYLSQDQELYYATRDAADWHISLIDSGGDMGSDLSLRLANGTTSHISYGVFGGTSLSGNLMAVSLITPGLALSFW